MPLRFEAWIDRDDLRDEPDTLFVFGDNLAHLGYGGQAKQMRGEPNAVGLPTKIKPEMTYDSFLSDDDYVRVFNSSLTARIKLLQHIRKGGTVVWPKNGIGTGLSKLPTKAPKIAKFYEDFLRLLENAAFEQRERELDQREMELQAKH